MPIYNLVYGIQTAPGPTPWTPGANTIGYYPLDSTNTVNDLSGNGNNGIGSGTGDFGTYYGVDCAHFGGSYYITIPYTNSLDTNIITISMWICMSNEFMHSLNRGIFNIGPFNGAHGPFSISNQGDSPDSNNYAIMFNSNYALRALLFTENYAWVNVVITYDGTNGKLYKNGILVGTFNGTSIGGNTYPRIVGAYYSSNYIMKGYMSNLILEKVEWTQQNVGDYYDLTKSDYGL